MFAGSRAEKFNIVSSDHERTQKCDFSVFNRKYPFRQIWLKKKNLTNSMVLFTFSAFDWKYPFWKNLVQKIKIVILSWKSVLRVNSNMQNSMMVFTFFFALDQKQPFWANLVEKIKIVSLSWNLVLKLIRVCRIQWWCLLFLF